MLQIKDYSAMIKINNIMFDVTDRCNFRCAHCYKEQDARGTDLPFDTISRFLDEIERQKVCSSIVISGGEPLLYPDLDRLLLRLHGRYAVRVNTNGYYLHEHIGFLKGIASLRLQVSLDGHDEETFYQIRHTHAFDRTVENTIKAKENGLSVYFRATLTTKTIDHYERFIDLSRETGIPIMIRPIVNTGEERQRELSIEYSRLTKWYEEVEQKGYLAYTAGRSPLSENSCPLLKDVPKVSLLTIDPAGNVYPCSLLRGGKFLIGNIKEHSLSALCERADDALAALKEIIFSPSCTACGFRKQLGDGSCAVACYFGNKKCLKEKIYGGAIR